MECLLSAEQKRRYEIVSDIIACKISRKDASLMLDLSDRQVRRLLCKVKEHSLLGVCHGNAGRVANNRFEHDKLERIKSLLIDKYSDFNAKFASEKLRESEGIIVSKEKIRRLQIELGLRNNRKNMVGSIHQSRARREKFGELIQIDGSHHDWFEGRGEKCCLIVFIDDATSQITSLHFEKSETTDAYVIALKQHIINFGIPFCLYSDRHGIFRVNAKDAVSGDGKTEFKRRLEELNINIINALSPQAKGRVERANRTLQDRLIKEMRLKNINNIEQANEYLPQFIAKHNHKFAIKANDDAHKPLKYNEEELDFVLSKKQLRTLSKNLEFSFDGKKYQIILAKGKIGLSMRNQKINIIQSLNKNIMVLYKNKPQEYRQIQTNYYQPITADDKTLNTAIEELKNKGLLEITPHHYIEQPSALLPVLYA